ncbi:hypothetical protein [Micromonospora sp. HUAS LYJ1]|uniref:hypothetical protein n=1 Tax=Micromonospora sp. HUAS LYJ1 TaxID=3061626 RepID=UPI0026727D5D|nr:hypothetical protein [Micromonospora sp. HUAS LYJ1]WKU03642.1 hypothetical protein Q2K16_22750 [Micromonospora sp. HUAS LYJ1]
MTGHPPPAPDRQVPRRTLLGLVPLAAAGLVLAAPPRPARAATPAPECLADLLGR